MLAHAEGVRHAREGERLLQGEVQRFLAERSSVSAHLSVTNPTAIQQARSIADHGQQLLGKSKNFLHMREQVKEGLEALRLACKSACEAYAWQIFAVQSQAAMASGLQEASAAVPGLEREMLGNHWRECWLYVT